MEIVITVLTEKSVRLIVDGDTVNDRILPPQSEEIINTRDQGTIELREMGA